jgi:hypothetical protein
MLFIALQVAKAVQDNAGQCRTVPAYESVISFQCSTLQGCLKQCIYTSTFCEL